LISLSIVIIYFLPNFFNSNENSLVKLDLISTILAGVTTVASVIFYIFIPKKNISILTSLVYLLLVATTASLVINTGYSTSPFISLWMLVAIFAGVFGVLGLLPILAGASFYTAWHYINHSLSNFEIMLIAFTGLLPLIVSFVIWHAKTGREENDEERAYKNLASELSEVANKSEVVINAIGDGVIAIDSQGIIRLINPAAQSIIGWGKQDALALNYKSILQMINAKNEPIEASADPIQQALNINQQVRTNVNMTTNSGKNIIVSLVVSPVGEVGSGVIIVFRDVTKEKAEEREQAEFISTASHEMRTPVASIEGYLGLALNPQTAQVDNRATDYISKAQAAAKHLGRLFQDLLDVSKADDGRISNNPKVVDIVTFTNDIVQGLTPKANDKGLKLTYKPMAGNVREKHITPVYYVNLDNDHIREVINNLVENAIKYTPKGEVIVDISGSEDHVVISVKDSGIGIPAEDMAHLFQKFYRVDNKDTREIGGTGLGLYLCRRLAEIMEGRIWAESVYGSGSTFFVELPRVDSQEASLLKQQEEFKAQQEAAQIAVSQPIAPVSTAPIAVMQTTPVITQPTTTPNPQTPATEEQLAVPVNPVPRSQSLTPEQIASYVAKQRALASQQSVATPANPTRPTTIPVRSNQ